MIHSTGYPTSNYRTVTTSNTPMMSAAAASALMGGAGAQTGTTANSRSAQSTAYPTVTTTTTIGNATYTSNVRYQPPGTRAVATFSRGVQPLYPPEQVPTYEKEPEIDIRVDRYRKWWDEATTARRQYV